MQLLKLLSEVIRISRPGSSEEESFLTPGSIKVNSCINLLGKIITGQNEVPAVVRQAIRCARLLQKHENGFTDTIVKSIGEKVLSYQTDEVVPKTDPVSEVSEEPEV